MWVGKTHLERLLEVGVEYLEGMDWIYHANSAQSKYRRQYFLELTKMVKMTPEELSRRKRETLQQARAEVAKTGIVQFRIDEDSIQRLYARANELKKPIGTMAREWVLERLAEEEGRSSRVTTKLYEDIITSINSRFDRLEAVLVKEKNAP